MKEALRYVWSYIRQYAWMFALALLLTVAVAGLSMVSPYATGKIVGEVIGEGLNDEQIVISLRQRHGALRAEIHICLVDYNKVIRV